MLGSRKALVVGLNHYDHYRPLTGCIRDAHAISELLARHEDGVSDQPNFDVKLLQSSDYPDRKITRARLRKEIEKLFEIDQQKSDLALFYFSGHGYENSLGGYLVTQDARDYEEGVSVNDLLIFANNSRIREIILLLDCCYAGNAGDFPMIRDGVTVLRRGLTIMTSSQSHEVSFELQGSGGVFTNVLVSGLQGLSADLLGQVKLHGLYDKVYEMLSFYGQSPTLKCNTEGSTTIRLTEPKIPRHQLKELPNFFHSSKQVFRLERLYADREGQDMDCVVEYLRSYHRLGLIEHLDETNSSMYDAMNQPLRMTVLGQLYWELAKRKLI